MSWKAVRSVVCVVASNMEVRTSETLKGAGTFFEPTAAAASRSASSRAVGTFFEPLALAARVSRASRAAGVFFWPYVYPWKVSERAVRITTLADILAVVKRPSATENAEITEIVPRAEPWMASAYLSRKSTGIAAPATAPIASEKLSAISTRRSS